MSWKRDEHPIVRWASFTLDHLSTINDLELATLKLHLVLEDGLRYLLAARLGVPDDSFLDLRIEFSLLLQIVTAGVEGHLVGALRALNRARNSLAHHVGSDDVEKNLATFVREIGYLRSQTVVWPATLAEQLDAMGNAFGEAAGTIFELAISAEKRYEQ